MNDQPPSRPFEGRVSVPVTDPEARLPRAFEGPRFAPFPPSVQTQEQRDRWYVCAAIVTHLSAQLEPSGQPDGRWVWTATRALYNSDIPTGEPDPDVEIPGDWHGPALEALAAAQPAD